MYHDDAKNMYHHGCEIDRGKQDIAPSYVGVTDLGAVKTEAGPFLRQLVDGILLKRSRNDEKTGTSMAAYTTLLLYAHVQYRRPALALTIEVLA